MGTDTAKNDKSSRTQPANLAQLKLAQLREELVESVREYTRSQKDLWARIPYLALKADGRTGYSDAYLRAYETGYWAIESGRINGYYGVLVDCATGELINPGNTGNPASDDTVLPLASHLNELDAAEIIAELRREGKKPVLIHSSPEKQKEWRREMKNTIKRLNLKPVYVRERRLFAQA